MRRRSDEGRKKEEGQDDGVGETEKADSEVFTLLEWSTSGTGSDIVLNPNPRFPHSSLQLWPQCVLCFPSKPLFSFKGSQAPTELLSGRTFCLLQK